MKHRTINIRWILILLAMALALPSWAKVGEKSKELEDVNGRTKHGKFLLWAKGEDVDIFFGSEKHDETFSEKKFHSVEFFNNAKGIWCYRFFIEQWNGNNDGHDSESRVISDVEVYIKGNDGKDYEIGKIETTSEGNVSNIYNSDLGTLESGNNKNEYLLYPSQKLLSEIGIKSFWLHFKYLVARHDFLHAKDKTYEIKVTKNVDANHGLSFTYMPMPTTAAFSVTSNGYLQMNVNSVPGHSQESYYTWKARPINSTTWSKEYKLDLKQNNTGWNANWETSNVSVTDNSYQLSPMNSYIIKYKGYMEGDKFGFTNPYTDWVELADTIRGFLYAINLERSEYDQWKNEVKISWLAQRTIKDATTNINYQRSTDGSWYVYREGYGEPELLFPTLAGTKPDSLLYYIDRPPKADVEYTYRVVFIPKGMDEDALSWFDSDLKPTIDVSTQRSVDITLSQVNDTTANGIKLAWTYYIPESGSTFVVQRSLAGSGNWEDVEQKNVVTSKTEDTCIDDKPASACVSYDYRVVANTLGSDFYSNVATNCNLLKGTTITSVDATKGTENNAVIVKWTVDQQGTDETYFNIERRPIVNGVYGDWVRAGETHGTAAEYSFTDERVEAGSFYEYRVIAYGQKCEDQVTRSGELSAIGYGLSQGTVSGHISYGSGNSVSGVRVNLIKSGTDSELQRKSYARFIHGTQEGGLSWTPDSAHYADKLNSNKPLSIQLWAAPIHERTYMPIFTLGKKVEVGLQYKDSTRYSVLFFYEKDNKKECKILDLYVPATRYSHYSVTYDGAGKWRFIVNGDTLNSKRTAEFSGDWTMACDSMDFHVGGATKLSGYEGNTFCGLVDDIRLWSRELTDKEVPTNFDRLLGGSENGLVLYWPLDEGINDYTFDVARQNGVSNQNHPTLSKNARLSTVVPSKLGIYGVTDDDGNYIVTGIPFDAGGTNYKLLPEFGVHEFQPSSRSLYISYSSLTANNVDFTDKSSFPMRGYVYYTGTNIPVKGLYLYVDGNLMNSDGKICETDDDGFYEISVPIGNHYVEAKQTGHTLVNEGRWPTQGYYDFQGDVYQNFSDSTLVNFCGRVAGGKIQEDKPVGFGALSGAKNNIGQATITLALKNNPNLSFNCEEGTTTDRSTTRNFYSQSPDTVQSQTWAGAGTEARYIYIKTDPKTGEFSALLPPLRYSVTDITVPKNPDLEFSSLPEINMTNPLTTNVDTLKLKDENADDTRNTIVKIYKYNQKMVNNWYADPTLIVKDNSDTLNIGAFGKQYWENYEDAYGKVAKIQIYHEDSNGTVAYDYDYPVFNMQEKYSFSLEAFEEYMNYDGEEPVQDFVRLSGQVLTVNNELSNNQPIVTEDHPDEGYKQGDVYELESNQLQLDSLGKYTYNWTAGLPNPTAPYTRHLSITYENRMKTYNFDVFDAYVFGALPIGNNFVTTGPDNVLMVLRDPPGSSSSTSWTTGKVKTRIEKSLSRGTEFGAGLGFTFINGSNIKTSEGIGVALITEEGARVLGHANFEADFEYTNAWSTTYTITNKETISTSSDPEFVGANGDVYIGVSTNLIIGDCKQVGFFRDGASDPFYVKDSLMVCIGDSVNTKFIYTQAEIETRQIPEWEKLRASMQIRYDSEDDAKKHKNTKSYPEYVTWKDPMSEDWTPDSSSYLMVMGTDTSFKEDSVLVLTNQINNWRMRISDNEEDKIVSKTNTFLLAKKKNISFDSGAGYSYTEGTDTAHVQTKEWHWKLGGNGDIGFGLKAIGPIRTGINVNISLHAAYTGSKTTGGYDDNYTNSAEFTYNFAESSIGTAHTVDCYKSQFGWSDHFFTQAGQTYCPYEPEARTKYYKPGQYVLSNATIPMQKPQIMVSNGNQNPSSNAVLTDVPSGQAAIYTLYLSNEVETDMAMTYVLSVKENTNPDGLQFTVDGVKLGNGRNIVVEPGETVIKTLEVTQTDLSILDYSNVTLSLASDCQDDISSINGVILDNCNINVHFKPSSSPVNLVADAFVVNTTPDNPSKLGMLELKISDFNRSFQNLKSMGVEYKAEGDTQWNSIQRYVFNQADSIYQGDIVVPTTGDVKLTVDMNDNSIYPDRTYIFRAYTETEYGTEGIRNYSNEVTVVKDMHRPMAIGTPQPADGILHAGDDIVVEFNEDIVPGYVNASNVTVTGKVNSQPTTHEVSLHLSGEEPTAATASDFYMQGNSTLATWLKYAKPGTLLTHCTGDNAFTLSIDADGHLAVKAGTINKATQLTLPKDEWMYLAYSYNEETTVLDLIIQHDTQTDTLYAAIGQGRTMQQVVHADDKRLFLGGNGLEANMHDLRIYGICRDPLEVATEKYNSTNIYTAGLMAHWPMDEGQGTKARDLRGDAHPLVLTAPNWHIDGINYAATVDATKEQHLDLNIATATTDDNESYVLEFWFKADKDVANQTLFQTGTKSNNTLRLFTPVAGQLAFEYGSHLQSVTPDNFDLSGGWHHFALNVMRGASASVSIDGKRTAVFSETDVPPLEGAFLVMGSGFKKPVADYYEYQEYMSGAFDEVRFWKGLLKPEVVQGNMYQCLDTLVAGTKGLSVYYPMEADVTINGVQTKAASIADMAPGQLMPSEIKGNFVLEDFTLNAPPLRKAPEVKTIVSNATVSDRKVFIELQPVTMAEIEGTTLDVSVTKIFDKNGNPSNPITWQLYVHQNTLSWAKDSVTCIKNYGDNTSFQVEVVNSGKSTEYYSVSNMPTWLTTDNAEGEVAPESTHALRFDVLPTAPVGTYDVNLTLTGNNEIAEPLRLVLKVKGVAPDWAVPVDSCLEDQMNLVSQVIIDGFVNENVESRLGAFIGTMCVGVASPEKTRGSYYVPMTIYGDVDRHNNTAVMFKFWDASTGITYVGLEASSDVKFKKDGMTGSYNYPVILTNSGEMEQRIDAAPGWNWMSVNVRPANNQKPSDILVADGFTKNDIIKSKTGISYYDGSLWSEGSLSDILPTTMYKLYAQQPVGIVVKGSECIPSQTPIKIIPQWNWIGYIPQTAMDINYALAGMGALEGDYIKSKSAFAVYGTYGWEGNLKTLEPGKGYMIYSQASDTLTFKYPDAVAASRQLTMHNEQCIVHNSSFSPVAPERYPDNMSLVVKLLCDGQPVDTFEVAAFIDGECRATAMADGGLYYLMVQGEGSGQPIQLRTSYLGEEIVIDESQSFRADSNIGLPWEPYIIDLGQAISNGIETIGLPVAGDARYFMPNGIQVKRSSIGKGQIYIRHDQSGKVSKIRK